MKKHSRLFTLLTGINEYDPKYYGSGNNLNECVNDMNRLEQTISQANSTRLIPIYKKLLDREAALEGVKAHMIHIAELAVSGDVVLFASSSHGTYIDTETGRSTGRCMYDGVLWDNFVLQILKFFRKGVTVLWVSDCCFSESTEKLIRPLTQLRRKVKSIDLPKAAVDSEIRNLKPTTGDLTGLKARVWALSASTSNEVAYEDENGGVLTEAIILSLIVNPNIPMHDLYTRVFESCSKKYPQHPVLSTINMGPIVLKRPFLTGLGWKANK